MAEKSGGGAQPSHWKCNNPACGKELPGAGSLPGMRVCPECNADQRWKDEHRCVHCKVELTDATHVIHHSKTCGPKTEADKDSAFTPTDPKSKPPSPKPDKSPDAPSKDKSSAATPQEVNLSKSTQSRDTATPPAILKPASQSQNESSTAYPQALNLSKSTQSQNPATPPAILKPQNESSTAYPQALNLSKSTQSQNPATPPAILKPTQSQNESSTGTPQPVAVPPVTGSDPKSAPDALHPDQNGDKPSTVPHSNGSSTPQTHAPVQESTSDDSSGQRKAELVIGAKTQEQDEESTFDTETQQNTGAVPKLNLLPVFGTTKREDPDKDSANKNGDRQQGNHTMNNSKQDQQRQQQQQTSKKAQAQKVDLSDTSAHPLDSNGATTDDQEGDRGQGKGRGRGGGENNNQRKSTTTNGAGPAGPAGPVPKVNLVL